MNKTEDVVIVGGGPAGYTAALYCARAGFSAVVVEMLSAGGQMATTSQVDNYPGFEEGIDGFELAEKMRAGAERFGARTVYTEVTALHLAENPKRVVTVGGEIAARAVVLATGASPRLLGVAREEALRGRGVSYCATCDGMFYKGKTVAVVGGGNSAAADALVLSKLCKSVYVVHRRNSLRASGSYHEALQNAANIEFVWNSQVEELLGSDRVTGLVLEDTVTGERSSLSCDGVFVAIGREPNTALVHGQVTLDDHGYIVADESTRTNLPGVYAVGDVRTKPLRQIVTAAADGAVASHYIEEYLSRP